MRHRRLPLIAAALLLACTPAFAQDYKGVNLAGAAFSPDILPGIYGQNFLYPNAGEIAFFTARGMNIFRLSVLWERVQPRLNGPLDPAELARLGAFVAAANQHHARVLIDIHNYGRYRGVAIGQPPVTTAAFADLWRRLAAVFGQNDAVVFGLMNEPQIAGSGQWEAAVQQAVYAIRKAGARNQILVSGTQWDSAAGFAAVSGPAMLALDDPAHRLIFEVHQYFDTDSSGTHPACIPPAQALARLQPFTQWLRRNNRQGFLGEFGVSRQPQCLAVLDQLLSYLKANRDVWSGWTYWAAGPLWGDYMYSIEPGPGAAAPQMAVLEKSLHSAAP